MAMREEYKGTWKDRIGYFWMYYKIPVCLLVIVAIMAMSFVRENVSAKPVALSVMMMDIHTDVTGDEIREAFTEWAGVNREKEKVEVDTSLMLGDAGSRNYQMGSLAKLYAQIGTEALDVCAMKERDYSNYTKSDAFLDLSEVFDPEEMDQFPALYKSVDGRILGVYCKDMPGMKRLDGYAGDEGVIGILYNTKHKEMAKRFLLYLNTI